MTVPGSGPSTAPMPLSSNVTSRVISPTRTETVAVRFQKLGKLYYYDCAAFSAIQPADFVIVETTRGPQMGQVMGYVTTEAAGNGERRPLLRIATPRELVMKQVWEGRQVEALINCREKAAKIGGYEVCKFLEAQYNYDGSYLTILFSAESTNDRINPARLRTALASVYPRTRIELRQIAARDVAKSLGGMGACGIPRCCSTFLTDFSPVSIKMAKAQGISLNPSEITGMCGRLRCCLVYEYEQYVQARKQLPKRGKTVQTPHGEGKVIDVHPLQDAVTVLVEDMRYTIKREQFEPLDELRALEQKAAAGCSKNESGGCDCGAKGEKASDADLEDEDSDDAIAVGASAGSSLTYTVGDDIDEDDDFDELDDGRDDELNRFADPSSTKKTLPPEKPTGNRPQNRASGRPENRTEPRSDSHPSAHPPRPNRPKARSKDD